jgi:hypothetical protein
MNNNSELKQEEELHMETPARREFSSKRLRYLENAPKKNQTMRRRPRSMVLMRTIRLLDIEINQREDLAEEDLENIDIN